MQQDKGRVNMRPDMAIDQLMIKTNSMAKKCKQDQIKVMQKERNMQEMQQGMPTHADTRPMLQYAGMAHSPVPNNG